MSLLSGLFSEIKISGAPRVVVTENVTRTAPAARPNQPHSVLKPTAAQPPPARELLACLEDGSPPYYIRSADTASAEWIAARDQYHNHLMTCRACHAPTERYCVTGAKLRQRYQATQSV